MPDPRNSRGSGQGEHGQDRFVKALLRTAAPVVLISMASAAAEAGIHPGSAGNFCGEEVLATGFFWFVAAAIWLFLVIYALLYAVPASRWREDPGKAATLKGIVTGLGIGAPILAGTCYGILTISSRPC